MNTNNWKPYYKQAEKEGGSITTQMCYTPLVSPDGKTFCMDYNYPSQYQLSQDRLCYREEFVELMWQREVEFVNHVRYYQWAPELVDIADHKIFFKWYGGTVNDVIYGSRDLENRHPTWRRDILRVITQQYNDAGIIKPTVYPHSYYYDGIGNLRTFDFYSCVYKTDVKIPYEDIKDLVSDNSRFDEALEDDQVNVETIFKSGLLKYSKWPDNLQAVYDAIFSAKD
jgi:hypothetical protein